MALCPRCKYHFRTLPDEATDHPCPRCGLSPWDVIVNGREEEEEPEEEEDEHVLCYVRNQWAFFTSQPLDKQWGDDWNDAPYEHNAGWPYEPGPDDLHPDGTPKWSIVQMAWEGPFEQPCDHHLNSPYSVEQINAGAVAWLRTGSWCNEHVVIPVGVTIPEFIRLVKKAGGRVWKEVEDE